jgi:hypothetical protein
VLGEDQFGFRRGKGTRDAIGMLRMISERTLDINDVVCACFIDWQKAFDCVNWTNLMQILKGIQIDWRKRRLISKLYMEQSVKIRLDQGETRSVKIGREIGPVIETSLIKRTHLSRIPLLMTKEDPSFETSRFYTLYSYIFYDFIIL